jgi:hypothetical protein
MLLSRVLALGVALSGAVACAAVPMNLISTDQPFAGWKPGDGQEFPGAKVSL